MFKILLVTLLMSTLSAMAIVGGDAISQYPNHPGFYNSVALLSRSDNGQLRFFCTGSIISYQHILTAKHCVAGKKSQDLVIYFGHETQNFDAAMFREVRRHQSVLSEDWTSFFPNLDIAVVEIQGEIPNLRGERPDKPRYRPLEILTDSRLLSSTPLSIVGFGNRNPKLGAIWAGEAHTITSTAEEVLNNTFFRNLVLIKNQPGQGVCHGDSGGPAYYYHPQLKRWMIAGVANGFDLSLTPDSLKPLADPLFPVVANCESGQVLYGFAGAYFQWIQDQFSIKLPRSTAVHLVSRVESREVKNKNSFRDWCESLKLAQPGWLTARTLIIKALKNRPVQLSERDVFENCEVADTLISRMTDLSLDEKDDMDSWEPLESLVSLKSLQISNRKDLSLEDARVFTKIAKLKKLSLMRVSIEDWRWVEEMQTPIEHLEIFKSQFQDVKYLRNWTHLVNLVLPGNQISDMSYLENWNSLKVLNVSDNKISSIKLAHTQMAPVDLDFSLNEITDISFLNQINPQSVEVLGLNGNPIGQSVNKLSRFKKLKQLFLRKTQAQDVSFLNELYQIETLDISQNQIRSLRFISDKLQAFQKLEIFDITDNQIQDLSPLAKISSLQGLQAGGNPITRSTKTCPTKTSSEALSYFCQNYLAAP